VSYTSFDAAADSIYFARSTNGGVTWTDFKIVSANSDGGLVQGSRVAVGPSGEVYATWYAIGTTSPYQDHFRIRKSTNQGVSFGTQISAAALFSNYGSGAPGFNRTNGITFPSITVDRSSGSHRGRVYLAWNEAVDFYGDNLGTTF